MDVSDVLILKSCWNFEDDSAPWFFLSALVKVFETKRLFKFVIIV